MKTKITTNKILTILLWIVILGIFTQFGYNEYQVRRYDRSYDRKSLSQTDKASIQEVSRLKNNYGREIWPGLQQSDVPVILFNDRYEFLTGTPEVPEGWKRVEGDTVLGKSYSRRSADNPQAFAVETGAGWAGSMSCLDYMNRDMLLKIREEVPLPLNRLLPSQMIVRSNDYHVVSIMHELFHAWQANRYSDKFGRSLAQSQMVDKYPYGNSHLNELFTREGKYLVKALQAKERGEKLRLARKFLYTRERRRKEMHVEYINYEKFYEWLEGLAKYTEIKAYEVAHRHTDALAFSYEEGMPYWETEWDNLEELGQVDGSSRFYLSGMAQARLLDQLMDNWKKQIMKQGVFPETLLRKLVR